jgi:hypothetical protein
MGAVMKRYTLEQLKDFVYEYVREPTAVDAIIAALYAGRMCRDVLLEQSGEYAEEAIARYDEVVEWSIMEEL